MRASLIFLLVLSLSSVAARASDWVRDGGFSVGKKTCTDWKKDTSVGDLERLTADTEWMFGFLTALVRAKGETLGGGMTPEDFAGEIDELCTAHPKLDIPAVLEIFAIRHKLIAAELGQKSN